MRPPWREAAPMLAAAGLIGPASGLPQPLPTGHQLAAYFRRRRLMPAPDVRFALLGDNPARKPIGFQDVAGLARHIQRERGEQGLDMIEVDDLEIPGDERPRRGVQIWTQDAFDARDRFLGTAWLDGYGLEALRSALRRERLVMPEEAA